MSFIVLHVVLLPKQQRHGNNPVYNKTETLNQEFSGFFSWKHNKQLLFSIWIQKSVANLPDANSFAESQQQAYIQIEEKTRKMEEARKSTSSNGILQFQLFSICTLLLWRLEGKAHEELNFVWDETILMFHRSKSILQSLTNCELVLSVLQRNFIPSFGR